jgi:hypothetical protein
MAAGADGLHRQLRRAAGLDAAEPRDAFLARAAAAVLALRPQASAA